MQSYTRFFLAAFLVQSFALSLLSPAASADQIYLTNGKVMEGKARQLEDGRVEVEMTIGTVTLPGEKVDRIERGETLEELVRDTLRTLPATDVASRFDLALWCREQGAHTLSRQLMEEILTLDPNHAGAREALGYRTYEGRWVQEQEYRELTGQMLYEGQWLPVETVHRLLAQRLTHQAEERLAAARRAELDAQMARLALAQEAAAQQPQPQSYGLPFYPSYGPYYGPSYGTPIVVVPPHGGVVQHFGHSGQRSVTQQPQGSVRNRTQARPQTRHQPRPHSTTLKRY